MTQILWRDPQSLIAFEQHAYVAMYGHYNCRNWRHWHIIPTRDMLAIQSVSHVSFLDNLQIDMLMEVFEVGP